MTAARIRSWLRQLMLVCAAIALTGCSSIYRAALDHLEATKPESLRAWHDAQIEGEPAQQWLWARSAMIVGGTSDFIAVFTPERTRVLRSGSDEPKADAGGAAPISADGYYLTAAHCVEKSPLWIVVRTDDGMAELSPARVVWAGDESTGGPDLAIVHADASTPRYLTLAEIPEVPGDVLCCGSGIGSLRWCGGRGIGAGGGEYSGVPCSTVIHTSPVSLGDSGGPAVDRSGKLIGVNIEIEIDLDGSNGRATAIRPDRQWLQQQIERDRARHPPKY